jgi:hypothetical protein
VVKHDEKTLPLATGTILYQKTQYLPQSPSAFSSLGCCRHRPRSPLLAANGARVPRFTSSANSLDSTPHLMRNDMNLIMKLVSSCVCIVNSL